MSYLEPPLSPSPEPPKALYEFDAVKWETQQVAENGGTGRAYILAMFMPKILNSLL